MIAYLDASVVLRLVLGERGRLAEWKRVETAVAIALTEVECLCTLDRLTRAGSLSDEELADRRTAVYRLLEATEVVDVSSPIQRRASEPSRRRWGPWMRFTCPPRSAGATHGART